VLLTAAGAAFAGLAAMPTTVVDLPLQVSAAEALAPVSLPALPPAPANVELMAALAQGLAVANPPPPPPPPPPLPAPPPLPVAAPPPVPEPPRAPARATRGRQPAEPETAANGAYARPGTGRLTSGYGRRWGRLHAGIDLAAGSGAVIRAAAAGTVRSAGTEGGYGRAIRIVHSDGTETLYAHNSSLLVSSGEKVKAGQQIAREGSSGNVTGAHLHFEVRINGVPVDPAAWLRKRGVSV
jgi:murein DD-endopeptidase MepM/ murein hydrolase activator NlpD